MYGTENSVLFIDNDYNHAKAFREGLAASGDRLTGFEWVRTLSEGLEALTNKKAWAIFLNLFLPDSQGVETLDRLRLHDTDSPIVVIAGKNDEDICRIAMQHGAQDYLLEGHVDGYAFARSIRYIIEREAARQELFIEKEVAQVTLNSIGDAVLSTDISDNVTYLNVVAEQMTGWSLKEAAGRPLAEVFRIIDGTTRKPSQNPMGLAVQENKTVGLAANCILIRRDGCESAIEESAAPIHDRNGQVTGAVMVFHDVSMARAMVLQMSHLAQHDVLTDLPNRVLLNDRLTQAISLARRNKNQVAVLFLDLDGFKYINDSLGHAMGDRLLQLVATRLSSCVRKSDTVSRQGGDEFVILLSESKHAADAGITATKLLAELRRVHSIEQHGLQITASIGISTYPDNGEDAETLIRNADIAMYQAKENGRNTYEFFDQTRVLGRFEHQSLS